MPFNFQFKPNLAFQFGQAVGDLVRIVNQAGIPLKDFDPTQPTTFGHLPPEVQEAVIRNVKTRVALWEKAQAEGVDLRELDALKETWSVLKNLGLRPNSDAFSHYRQGDIIEIYDMNNIQIFCSMNMMACVSYPYEKLLTTPWNELYDRPAEIQNWIMGRFEKAVVTGETQVVNGEDHHVLKEKGGLQRKALYQGRAMSPIYDSATGKPAGVMNIITAAVLRE